METAVAKVEAQREQAAGQLAETQLEVPAERTAQEPVQRTAKAPEQKRPEPEPEVPRTPEPESRKAAGKPELAKLSAAKNGTANRAWVEKSLAEKGYEIIDDVYHA